MLLAVVIADTASEQQQALDALFASTGGSTWSVATGWSVGSPACARFGVRCNEQLLVEGLELPGNALRGTLPSELSLLRHLKTLNLAVNELHGELPSSLVQLRHLRQLALTSNKLGPSFPEWLVELPELEHASLAINSFAGTIPRTVLEHFRPPRLLYALRVRLSELE